MLNGRDGATGAPVDLPLRDRDRRAQGPDPGLATCSPRSRPTAGTSRPPGRPAAARDVVILDGATGGELVRVTNDDASFAPSWSPAGDGIAFLHLDGQTVDLRLARLGGSAPRWTIDEIVAPDGGLGAGSGVPPGLVHPGRPVAGDPAADRPAVGQRGGVQRPVTYLQRLDARMRLVGTVLCLGLDPDH